MYIYREKIKCRFTLGVVCSSLFAAHSFTHKSAKTHQTAATDNLVCAQQVLSTKEQQSYITLPPSHFSGFLKKRMCFQMQGSGLSQHRA